MFKKIISVITLVLVGIVVFAAQNEIIEAVQYLSNTNIFILLLLLPEQLFMYYCAGQIFFAYMAKQKNITAINQWTMARISFELNFVNHAIPSGGISGLGYITWRLKRFGATAGQTSFVYLLRYFITIMANQFQTLLAIFALSFMGVVNGAAWGVIGVTLLVSLGVIAIFVAVIIIASNRKRIIWFSGVLARWMNRFAHIATFGMKKNFIKLELVNEYFNDLHQALMEVRKKRSLLLKPLGWGILYSFLEVATYWLVASSMGHPEILPQIMVAEAIGSAVGAVLVTPGGVGGYEGAMIFVMSALGVETSLATAVTIATRVVILVGTIASGYIFYQHAISTSGESDLELPNLKLKRKSRKIDR